MQMTDNGELLRQFVKDGSDRAFGGLVSVHVDLVYCSALRKLGGDTHLAQDITQTVFADLARKARMLPANVVLGGWLYRHTCFRASEALRKERRRKIREQTAMEMKELNDDSDAMWRQIAPLIDDAMQRLNSRDRDAIVLRFFERKDLRTVGATLGINDDAAQKRVARALEKLRGVLSRRGATLTATTLASAMAAEAVTAAPDGIA